MEQNEETITIQVLANYMISHDERGFWHMSKLTASNGDVEMICEEVEIFDLFKEIHEQHLLNHHEYFSQKRIKEDLEDEEEFGLCDERGRPL